MRELVSLKPQHDDKFDLKFDEPEENDEDQSFIN